MRTEGFPPVVDASTRVLVLGTLPGTTSLPLGHYYAHPRNQFWPIMCDLLDVPLDADYAVRLAHLAAQGVGLWNVLKEAERPGSLDASIVAGTEVVNDFRPLAAACPRLTAIAFNGKKAAAVFRRHVAQQLESRNLANIELLTLPSTSPAHAALSYAQKRDRWSSILRYLWPAHAGGSTA